MNITYYTDPLCCWSWALEPQWRRLRYEFGGQVRWRYRMGGLIPDWNSYDDPINSVSRPAQMGPIWMEASHKSGMPMSVQLWMKDSPHSSYPACIAVKCAQLQSPEAGEKYLRALREAVMEHSRNVAKTEVLLEVAQSVAWKVGEFNVEQFKKDFNSDRGQDAFRKDMEQVRFHNIGRFPTLILQREGAESLMMTGYRPYEVLLDALKQIAPDVKPVREVKDVESYKEFWGSITDHEVEEALRPLKDLEPAGK